jgi:hypothetical protein
MIDGFAYDDSPEVRARAIEILQLLRPVEIEGLNKIRVGRANDGGYVMLDDFSGVKTAYSIGIKDDTSWDRGIADRGIDLFQYDHTIDALPEKNPRFRWFKIGLAAIANREQSMDTLTSMIHRNGHQRDNKIILKMDIEGAEWDVFGTMRSEEIQRFGQIVCEFHGFQYIVEPMFSAKILKAFKNITQTHRLVHVHANNNTAYAIVGGVPIPAVLEITFGRVIDRRYHPSNETFPTALDMPCFPGRADYALGTFTF